MNVVTVEPGTLVVADRAGILHEIRRLEVFHGQRLANWAITTCGAPFSGVAHQPEPGRATCLLCIAASVL